MVWKCRQHTLERDIRNRTKRKTGARMPFQTFPLERHGDVSTAPTQMRLRAASPETFRKTPVQEGSCRCVGTCRHSNRRIFTMTAEAGFCHVLPLLDWSDLHGIRVACGKLPKYIKHRQRSLARRCLGMWRHPAPEDANNILTRWNKNRKRKQQEERPWYSSPFGRPEEMRETWSYVLHRSTPVGRSLGRLRSSWSL